MSFSASGIVGNRMPQKNRSVEPRPLLEPRRRGALEQHLANAPFRGRGTSTASSVQEPEGSGSPFSRKQFLTLTRRSNCQFNVRTFLLSRATCPASAATLPRCPGDAKDWFAGRPIPARSASRTCPHRLVEGHIGRVARTACPPARRMPHSDTIVRRANRSDAWNPQGLGQPSAMRLWSGIGIPDDSWVGKRPRASHCLKRPQDRP